MHLFELFLIKMTGSTLGSLIFVSSLLSTGVSGGGGRQRHLRDHPMQISNRQEPVEFKLPERFVDGIVEEDLRFLQMNGDMSMAPSAPGEGPVDPPSAGPPSESPPSEGPPSEGGPTGSPPNERVTVAPSAVDPPSDSSFRAILKT